MTHDDIAAALVPIRRDMAAARNTASQLAIVEAGVAKVAGLVHRGLLAKSALVDAVVEQATSTGMLEPVGEGAYGIAIARGLKAGANEHDHRLAIPANEFTANLDPIDFLVDELILTGCIYTLTAKPGNGKTSITILLALCVSRGLRFAGREVDRGAVLYFAGENPDDIKRRWLATCQRNGVDPGDVDNVFFVPGAYRFSEIAERIAQEMSGGVKLVIVDTSAVYFEGEDENDNVQAGEHAQRMRTVLGGLAGHPTVLINAHPARAATEENMVPRGGSAFEAAIDGNLFCKKVDTGVQVHHTTKFRGVEFEPLTFQIHSVTHERVKTVRGKLIQIPVAEHISEMAMDDIEKSKKAREDEILVNIRDCPAWSLQERATALGWKNRFQVRKAVDALVAEKLVRKARGGRLELTPDGTKEAKRLKDWLCDEDQADEKL